MSYSLKGKNVFVAGHRGMVGSAIVRRLETENCTVLTRGREDLDLCNQAMVEQFFKYEKIDVVFLCAAKVGGILANKNEPADFIYQNLMIQTNLIHAAFGKVEKLIFLGSSCIYPRDCPQPIQEEYLLTGPLEKTNEAYAIAKIAGLKMIEYYRQQYGADFISVMPTNLYGINDTYDLEKSHVIPALLMKTHQAKIQGNQDVTIWGSGAPKREFLFADDLADACVLLAKKGTDSLPINIGTGEDITIKDLAHMIKEVVGFEGRITFDISKPDGTPRKVLDISKIANLGWQPKTSLRDGLKVAYNDYVRKIS